MMHRGLKKRLKNAVEDIQTRPIVPPVDALGVRSIAGDFASEDNVVRHTASRLADMVLELAQGSAALTGRG